MRFITRYRAFLKVLINPDLSETQKKQSTSSNVKVYEKDNEVHKIHFPMLLGGLTVVNAPGENLDISGFNEIKIILLMFTGSQALYLGVYTDLNIGNWEKC